MRGIFKNWKTTTGGAVTLLAALFLLIGLVGWIDMSADLEKILILAAFGGAGSAAVFASEEKKAKKDHSETNGE